MKIKDGFVKQQMGDKFIIVSSGNLSKEFHGMIELNTTAADIWDWVSLGFNFSDVSKKLSEKYNIELSKAELDTKKIIDKMISAGVFENE